MPSTRNRRRGRARGAFRGRAWAVLALGVAGMVLLGRVATQWPVSAADYRPIVRSAEHHHDKWGPAIPPGTKDIVREFGAFTVLFDGPDDDDGDGAPDLKGVPEWVAYHIKGMANPPRKGPARPRTWMTDPELFRTRIAPDDSSYRNSGYNRGHLCQKLIAFRLGADADWNSHTVLNACPQIPAFNQGIWNDLEQKTAQWADSWGEVWVITGPVFHDRKASRWIGDPGEVPVAVPDAFFKIIVRETGNSTRPVEVLAFLCPHEAYPRRKPYDHTRFIVSIDRVEEITGHDFLAPLEDSIEDLLERETPRLLWN